MKYIQAVAVFCLIAQTGLVWGKGIPLIKKLTSDKVAQEVEKDIPRPPAVAKKRRSRNAVPEELKVHSLGLGLGQTFIKGDMSKHGQDGITLLDFFYNYSVSYSFDLMLNVHYSEHFSAGSYAKLRGAAVGIKGKLYEFDSFYPFVMGGFGFYGPKTKDKEGIRSPSKVVFGIHAGGGGELILNRKFSLGLLAHYHNPFDVRHETGSAVEGFYFKLLVMTLYRF